MPTEKTAEQPAVEAPPTRRARARAWLGKRGKAENFTENLALITVLLMILVTFDTREQADTSTKASNRASEAAERAEVTAESNTRSLCEQASRATTNEVLPLAVFDLDHRVLRIQTEAVYVSRMLGLRDALLDGLSHNCAEHGQPPTIDAELQHKLSEVTAALTPSRSRERRSVKPMPIEVVQSLPAPLKFVAPPEGNRKKTAGGPQRRPGDPGEPDAPNSTEGPSDPADGQTTPQIPSLSAGVLGLVDGLAAPVCSATRPLLPLC